MGVIPSLNTILSLLSFLTVIFALARVGAAAFSANQAQEDSASGSEANSPGEKTHHRSWQLSRAVAAPAAHLLQLQLTGGVTESGGMPSPFARFGPSTPSNDLLQAIRYGLSGGVPKQGMRDKEKGKDTERMVEYIGGHELVRMPASTWTGARRPGILFRPPSPFPDQTKPLSMAKLIMSRHQNQRRTNRPPPVRRPPGLPAQPTSRSRLVEEV
ncbi:hypothetical protein ACEPAG_1904 [Sanghuangporus baumii]